MCGFLLVIFQFLLTVICISIQPAFLKNQHYFTIALFLMFPSTDFCVSASPRVCPHGECAGVAASPLAAPRSPRWTLSSQAGFLSPQKTQVLYELPGLNNYILISFQHQEVGRPPKNLIFSRKKKNQELCPHGATFPNNSEVRSEAAGARVTVPKDAHSLIPGTCKYAGSLTC